MSSPRDVLVLPAFLRREEAVVVREHYNSLLAGGLAVRGTTTTTDVDASSFVNTVFVEEVAAVLHAAFPGLPELAPDYVAYSRMTEGAAHRLHADAVREDGSPNHTPWRVVTAMLYLSDCGTEFSGGSIRFEGVGRTIEPKAGMLVGFLTGWEHRHQVAPVTGGTRDALIFWFMDRIKQRSCGTEEVALPSERA